MDIQNTAVKFLTQKVNSDNELSKADLNKWIKPLPIEVTKYIKDTRP